MVWNNEDGRLDGPVHAWFELSYAQYLTVPRSVPREWQERFAACLDQLDEALPWRPAEGRYWCRLKDVKGRFVDDPCMDYRHRPVWMPETLQSARGER